MVCVTVQKTCERLIREGAMIAGDAELKVMHVVKPGDSVLGGGSESDALEYLFRISRTYGAEMDMLRSEDVIGTIAEFAKKHDIAYIVMGATPAKAKTDVAASLGKQLSGVEIIIIP